MSGNPKECRERALECLGLAQASTIEDERKRFAGLAEIWLKLAAEFEADQALISALSALEAGSGTKRTAWTFGRQAVGNGSLPSLPSAPSPNREQSPAK